MPAVKPPAVAGLFYPADPEELAEEVKALLRGAPAPPAPVRALIAPHAGYPYSGPVAASAYARIQGLRGQVRRVVLIGPSHHHLFEGIATSGADAFRTPLGEVRLDPAGREAALSRPQVKLLEAAFEEEHALEVHLPFLQVALGEFLLVPLLTGEAEAEQVAEALELLWEESCLVAASSDLSHFHPAARARRLDTATARAVEGFRLGGIGPRQACGHLAIRGLLLAARRRRLRALAVDLRNSAEAGGPADRVVGYGAFILVPEA